MRNMEEKSLVLDLDEFTSKTVAFLFDGVNAVVYFLAFIVYELYANPDIQKKLQKEIHKNVKENGINFESLSKMKYLEMITKGSLIVKYIMNKILGFDISNIFRNFEKMAPSHMGGPLCK